MPQSLSLFEKAVVLKGFGRDTVVTLQGDLSSGSFLCWHNLGALFLADRFCKSDRYDAVLCFHADDSNTYSSSNSSGVKQATFVSLSNPLLTSLQLIDIIENNIKQAIAKSSTQDGKAAMAVIIFGFSEFLLRLGLAKSLELLETVQKCRIDESASLCNDVTKCIVLVVNSSLHCPAIVERLIELSATIITTSNCSYIDTSNSSYNSSGNFAEVYTMRKTTSGRINEDIELFGYDASPAVRCMYPLLDTRIGTNLPTQSTNNSSCDKSGCTDHNHKHSHDSDHSHGSKELLVTFDSNDPEVVYHSIFFSLYSSNHIIV